MFGTYCRLNVRVLDSDRTVIRELRSRFTREALRREKRELRHKTIRQILAIHHKEAETYLKYRF